VTSESTDRLRPETAWVLARAFLPPDFEQPLPPEPEAVWAEAVRLRMAPRIGSRCNAAQLALELGPELGAAFQSASRHAALDALKVEAMVRSLAKVAETQGVEIALLKGTAFHLARLTRPGARPLADCDILIEKRGGLQMQRALLRDGWARQTIWGQDYHLPPVAKPGCLSVEIHRFVPLLRVSGRTWTAFGDLHRMGLLDTVPPACERVRIPDREVLAGHAIAHAVAQPAGLTERAVACMLADIADTGLSPELLAARVRPWTNGCFSQDFWHHLCQTIDDLASGSEKPLDHFAPLCRELDRAARRLGCRCGGRVRRAMQMLPGAPSPVWSRARSLLALVFLCKPSLSRVYGKSGNESYPRLLARRYLILARRFIVNHHPEIAKDRHATGDIPPEQAVPHGVSGPDQAASAPMEPSTVVKPDFGDPRQGQVRQG